MCENFLKLCKGMPDGRGYLVIVIINSSIGIITININSIIDIIIIIIDIVIIIIDIITIIDIFTINIAFIFKMISPIIIIFIITRP